MRYHGNILLADDEETFLNATAELFREEGYDCHCVSNAHDAIEALAVSKFDLLVTDINMPGNMSLELLSKVQEKSPNLPIIVVTGYPSVPTAITSLRLRVLDYLTKPVGWPDLLECVNRGMSQSKVLGAVARAKDAATAWAKNLESIEQAFSGLSPEDASANVLMDNFVEQAMDQIHKELGGLRVALSTQKGHFTGQCQDLCSIIRCSRLAEYERLRLAIQHAIDVLQKTKGAFKSKDLGILRMQLQDLLKETQPVV